MTEGETQELLRYLDQLIHHHRDTPWFRGRKRDEEIAIEAANFVLARERSVRVAKVYPPSPWAPVRGHVPQPAVFIQQSPLPPGTPR